jgi:Ca-activated chloride channel family protein
MTMRLVEGATPHFVWRVVPLISRLDHRAVAEHDIQVFLGDITHGSGQSLLADMLVPGYEAGTHRLVQADITYDVPATGLTGQKVSLEVMITVTKDPALAQKTDGRVMNIIERVVAHKLQTQALDEAAAGEAVKATQRLRAAATRLLELGEVDMAEQATEQASKIEKTDRLMRQLLKGCATLPRD